MGTSNETFIPLPPYLLPEDETIENKVTLDFIPWPPSIPLKALWDIEYCLKFLVCRLDLIAFGTSKKICLIPVNYLTGVAQLKSANDKKVMTDYVTAKAAATRLGRDHHVAVKLNLVSGSIIRLVHEDLLCDNCHSPLNRGR